MLTGVLVMVVSADQPTVTFVNPFGIVEPGENQPLAARLGDLEGKTIRMLQHGAANGASQLAMARLRTALNAAGAVALAPAAFGGDEWDARSTTQYDTWAAGVDAVIIGVVESNIAAWWVGYHAKQIEARGVPVVVLTTDWFYSGVRAGTQDNGIANLRVVSIPNSPWADAQGFAATDAARGNYINNNIIGGTINLGGAVISALTAGLTPAELSSAPLTLAAMGIPNADGKPLAVDGHDALQALPAFQTLSMELGFGDGLPMAVPTQLAVDAMVAASGRPADEVIGRVMLRGGLITVENVAANAVMAGARPKHFPAILAAMEAYANSWEDNKLFYRSVMSHDQRQIVLVISGPIVGSGADQLDVSRGRTLDLGKNDSAVIGRAFMLCVRNIGHIPFENSNAMNAFSRIYSHETLVFGEENLYLPTGWVPMSEHMGFGAGSNTVTLVSTSHSRITSGVGGTAAGGTAGALDSPAQHRTQATAANGFETPRIHIVHWRDAHQFASNDNRAAVYGGWGNTARNLTTKNLLQQWIAGTGGSPTTVPGETLRPTPAITRSQAREALVWPIVAGFGHSTQGRVLHGGSAVYNNSRGFHTQRIGGDAAPSAPQDFVVNVATPGQVTMTWAAPERGTPTLYEVSVNGGRSWVGVGTNLTATLTLDAGQYFFAVRARSAVRNSADVRTGVGNATVDFNTSSGRGAWAWDAATVVAVPIVPVDN